MTGFTHKTHYYFSLDAKAREEINQKIPKGLTSEQRTAQQEQLAQQRWQAMREQERMEVSSVQEGWAR